MTGECDALKCYFHPSTDSPSLWREVNWQDREVEAASNPAESSDAVLEILDGCGPTFASDLKQFPRMGKATVCLRNQSFVGTRPSVEWS